MDGRDAGALRTRFEFQLLDSRFRLLAPSLVSVQQFAESSRDLRDRS
jgi:hypothetical protein